jgi:hypothetical protein
VTTLLAKRTVELLRNEIARIFIPIYRELTVDGSEVPDNNGSLRHGVQVINIEGTSVYHSRMLYKWNL